MKLKYSMFISISVFSGMNEYKLVSFTSVHVLSLSLYS